VVESDIILPIVCLATLFPMYKLFHFLSNATFVESLRLIRIRRR